MADAPTMIARIGDGLERAERTRTVPTEDPTVRAIVAKMPGTRGSVLVALEADRAKWAGRDAELLALAKSYQTGDALVRIPTDRKMGMRELKRANTALGLYWFECYLPWIPVEGRADVAAIDSWGAVMELGDLADLAHQAIVADVAPEFSETPARVVQSFVNSAEIASPRFYRGAHVVGVHCAADPQLVQLFTRSHFVRWNGAPARVVSVAESFGGLAYLDVTPVDAPAATGAWARHDFSGAHGIVRESVSIDQNHDEVPTKVRMVQSWLNLTGVVDSPTHYPNAWNIVLDASGDPPIKARLDRGEYRAVSFHATGWEVPTVYPAELVQAAIDPYGGAFDRTRDAISR